jgi:hypothetical protein
MGRHRWMYYATGLPGWMRFGFSPGWMGRSPIGLGPCATYMLTGGWPTPQAQAYWDAAPSSAFPHPAGWMAGLAPYGGMPEGEELDFLKQHAEMLSSQLESINKRISELQESGKDQGQSV